MLKVLVLGELSYTDAYLLEYSNETLRMEAVY
jgi:hypothetical protein